MKTTPTKQRILDAALLLFNEQGYVHVRLQHIAEAAGMSVGNMAYHYPHKEDILHAIYRQLRHRQEKLLGEINLTPVFENFDYFLRQSFQLQQQYRFFYQDTLELMRESEALKAEHQELIQFQQMQLEVLLTFNQARGALAWNEAANPACRIARQVRRSMDSWLYLQMVEGYKPDDLNAFRKNVWRVVQPYFTEMGWQEFTVMPALSQPA